MYASDAGRYRQSGREKRKDRRGAGKGRLSGKEKRMGQNKEKESLWKDADVVYLVSQAAENERFVRDIAIEEQEMIPEAFEGEQPYVYMKLRYAPAYEPFRGVKSLILTVRQKTGMRAAFKGIVAADVSEWITHEKEEYFTIFLKFLHDHRKGWKFLFTVGRADRGQVRGLLMETMRYLKPKIKEVSGIPDDRLLFDYIGRQFRRMHKRAEKDAVRFLADKLAGRMKPSYEVTDLLTEDLCRYAGRKRITKEMAQQYWNDEVWSVYAAGYM